MKLFAPFTKVEDQPDGTVYVEGVASSEAVDADGETILASAMKAAIPDYMRFPALREMHQLKAAGKTLAAHTDDEDGRTYVSAKVVDSEAVKKVKQGVYSGFSIGGKALQRNASDRNVIEALSLIEISLVDRPTNPDAVISLWKAEAMDPNPNDRPLVKMTPILTAFSKGKLSADDAEQQLLEVLKVAERKDVSPEAGKEKYGDVEFADAKNKKYPIDTEEHIRAAWNYINKPANAGKYSSEDAASIKRRIVAAWKKKIDKDGPPSAKEDADAGASDDPVSKSMYHVARAAELFDGLQMLHRSCEMDEKGSEGAMTGMQDAMRSFAGALKAMLDDELSEALAGEDEEGEKAAKARDLAKAAGEAAKKLAEAIKEKSVKTEPKSDAEKAIEKAQHDLDEKLRAAQAGRDQAATAQSASHEALRKALELAEQLKKQKTDEEAQTRQIADAIADLQKKYDAEIAKVNAETEQFGKIAAQATEQAQKANALNEQLVKELAARPKGVLKVVPVSKAQDNGTAAPEKEAADPKDPVALVKAVHAGGPSLDLTAHLRAIRKAD